MPAKLGPASVEVLRLLEAGPLPESRARNGRRRRGKVNKTLLSKLVDAGLVTYERGPDLVLKSGGRFPGPLRYVITDAGRAALVEGSKMKFTKKLIADVCKRVRALFGRPIRIEVGERASARDEVVANALLWAPEADLWETTPLALLEGELECPPELPGCATLDLYVYEDDAERRGGGGDDLIENVYVVIKDGAVADVHNGTRADERTRALLGVDFSPRGDA